MSVKIGHASIDENNKAKGGNAGDQTGKEVCTRNWYSKPWTSVIRPNKAATAEKIARAMEQACANDNIGYDQSQRTTLYTKAKEVNWDISKITSKCECDCSSLVAVCVNAAGIGVSKDIYTGNELSALKAAGAFTIYTDAKHTGGSGYLKRGDILLGSGHTAIVLSDGGSVSEPVSGGATTNTAKVEVKANEAARNYLKTLEGTYTVTAAWLNVRHGAGATKAKMTSIPKGTVVRCYGYYTAVLGTKWLYVQFTYNGIKHIGFVSEKYLTK